MTLNPDGGAAGAAGPEDRHAALIDRLYRMLERQAGEIEERMTSADAEDKGAEFERQARTLANVTRVIEKLVELKRSTLPAPPDGAGQEQDADRLRREIAERLERIWQQGQG